MKRRRINEILEDNGSWLLIDVSTARSPNLSMKIDKKDWEMLSDIGAGSAHAWNFGTSRTAYAKCMLNGKDKLIHRLIFPCDGMIDHINRDGLDNRRSNLRSCTASDNQLNKSPQSNNKSGYAGVHWHTRDKKWQAYIKFGNKQKFLGVFKNKCDAIQARKVAESELMKKSLQDSSYPPDHTLP